MQTGSLGDTIFEVSSQKVLTPSSVSCSRDMTFEEHQVPAEYARTEFIAPGLATFTLAITLRKDLGVEPLDVCAALEDSMVNGEVLRLCIAGLNLGKFTIRKMDMGWKYLVKSGSGPLAIDLSLELKEYH